MTTLRDLLRDADPFGNEPQWSAQERQVSRQIVVAAPRAAGRTPAQRVAMAAIVAAVVLTAAAIGSRVWSDAAVVEAAAVRFEVRLAEEKPTGDLREAAVSQSGATVYLHQAVVVTNSDIDRAKMVPSSDSAFSVIVEFTAEGAGKMLRATQGHMGRPLAILVDGEVVSAPVVRGPISTSAVIDGNYTTLEAERIVAGIRGR